ncbi:MAG: peroxidase-related enzyme [Xanthomonadales bacterium]|nr:peroxidase-related enzyme [Xanthomonadales bacterium]
MARIQPLDLDQADPTTRQTLDDVKRKLGTVPNLIATLAHSPTALHGYLGFADAATRGRLSAGQREIVALAVAQANSCAYCLAAHTFIGKNAGLDDGQVQAARRAEGGSAADAALARFAAAVVEQRGLIGDDQISALTSAGFDQSVVIEVVALVALNTLTNYVNHAADTDIDFPRVDLAAAA